MKISIVSGYFNPIHQNHIKYINSSRLFEDYLIVIVNSDYQVKLKTCRNIPVYRKKYKISNYRLA
jgi:cytidyltransferase-like protein